MDAETLKPCPFCGGADVHVMPTMDDDWWAFCAAGTCKGNAGYFDTNADAIAAWNTRPAPPSDVVGVRAELERQMDQDQDEHLPSSIARDRGLVWLEGWFNLAAALSAKQDARS